MFAAALASLSHRWRYLEETKLQDAPKIETEQILPDLCAYEVPVSWLPENLFGLVTMHTHRQHATMK